MPKTAKPADPAVTHDLTPDRTTCPHCGGSIRADYANHRTVHTLAGVTRLNLTVRRCDAPTCPGTRSRTGPRPRARSPSPGTSSGWT